MKTFLFRLTAISLLAALSVAGCSQAVEQGLNRTCSSTDDCSAGEICHATTRRCLPSSTTMTSLEVLPPSQNNQGWVLQEFPKVSPGPDGQIAIQLESGVSLEGLVYASDTKERIPARLVAYRDSIIPGRPAVQVEATAGDPRRENQKESFVLWLNRGHSYTFHVEPLAPYDTEYPPLVVTVPTLTDHRKQDFVLYGKNQSVEVRGAVKSFSGSPLGYSVRIRAYQSGGFVHSTIAKSDPKTGAFSFRVPPGVAPYTLLVESLPGSSPIPTMECTNVTLGLVPAQQANQPLGEVLLPVFRFPETFKVRVRGKMERKADETPVIGASVTFSTTVPVLASKGFEKCNASYTQTSLTNTDGVAALELLPGSDGKNQGYSVTVVSPPRSPFASQWISSLELGAKGGVLADLMLAERYFIKGHLLHAGKPISGASIEAEGIGSAHSTTLLPVTKAGGTTDKEGRFDLFIDPGIYNINIRPSKELGLPSFGLSAVKIDGNIEDKVFEVPSAKAIAGKVVDPKGKDLPGAQVQVYDLLPSMEQPVVYKAVLRASSFTDEAGGFTLLLPAPADQ